MSVPTYRKPAALELPFDQYQRYATAARVIEQMGGWAGRRILDVGGAPGFLELFFDEAKVAVVDRYGSHDGNFIVADGAKLPFADGAFDIVITLDTLEHIPAEHRAAFRSECRRVTGDLLILSAPHATEGVALAESALQEFVTARFGAAFGTLKEHSDNGLPLIEETVAAFEGDGWHAVRLPSGYLPRWLLGMIFHHELLAVGMSELPALHRFYNERQSLHDYAEPSYRQVVIASGRRSPEELQAVVDSMLSEPGSTDGRATLAAIGGAVLSARLSRSGDLAQARQELARTKAELHTMKRRGVEAEARRAGLESRGWRRVARRARGVLRRMSARPGRGSRGEA